MTKPRSGWARHPGVRSGASLPLGDRAADKMRNGMGSWAFVFCALSFLAVWMLINGRRGFCVKSKQSSMSSSASSRAVMGVRLNRSSTMRSHEMNVRVL